MNQNTFTQVIIRATYLSVIIILFNSVPAMANVEASYSLAQDIADNYVRSFSSEKIKEDKINKAWNVRDMRPPKLGEASIRSIIFNDIFNKSDSYRLIQERMSPILNEYAWKDLKLFYGSTSAPNYHFIGRINQTVTTLGECVLATFLVTPTNEIILFSASW